MKNLPLYAHNTRHRFWSLRSLSRNVCGHRKFALLLAGSTLAALGLSAQSAQAQNVTDTYIGAAGGDWSAGTNWSLGTPPASNNDVLFTTGSGATSTISGEAFNIGSYNATLSETVTNTSTTASTLTLGGGSATTDQVAGSNPADLIFVNTGATLLNGGVTGTGGALNIALGQNGRFDVSGGSLFIGATAAGVATGVASTLNLGTFTLTFNSVLNAPNAANITNFDVISGTGSIVKMGNGQTSLASANTFTGGVTIEQGSFNPNNAAGLGAGTSAVALGDATSITNNLSPFLFVSGNTTITRNVTVGASNAATTGFYTVGSGNGGSRAHVTGAFTLNQNLFVTTAGGSFFLGDTNSGSTLTSGATGTQTVTFNNAGNQFISTAIGGGTGTIGVTKVGGGTAFLAAANTYTGTTTVNQGTLSLTGSLAGSSALVVNGGTFAYNPGTFANTAGLNADPAFTAVTGASQTVNGLTVNSGNSGVSVTTGNTLNLGAITRSANGTVAFTPTGTGTITTTSTGANGILGTYAYTGTAAGLSYVTPGTVAAYTAGTTTADATGVTDTTGTVNYNVSAGGTVGTGASANTVRYTGAAGTVAGPVTLNGLMNAGTGALTVSGPVTIGANNELVVLANTQATTITGAIGNGTAASSLTYGGAAAGTLTLSGLNTYTGGTFVDSGTVALAAGPGGVLGNITVNPGAVLSLTSNNALGTTAGSAVNTVNVRLGTVTNGTAGSTSGGVTSFNLTGGTMGGTGTYNFNVAAATPPTINTNASVALSTISSGVVIQNTGTLALNVASGVIGQDPRTASDLTVTGVISQTGGTGAITKTGAGILTLTGTNTYAGGTTISAGTVQTTGTGTLGTGNITLRGTAALTLENTGTSQAIAAGATLTFSATSRIALFNAGTDTLTALINGDNNTDPLTPNTTYTAQQLDAAFGVNTFSGSGTLTVTTNAINAVPEPSTWVGLVLGASAFGLALRRRAGAQVG